MRRARLTHTVWFPIVGIGSEIMLDTAGSDFGKVIDAYAFDANGTPVWLVASTTQARAT